MLNLVLTLHSWKLWTFTNDSRVQLNGKHFLYVCLQFVFESCIQYIFSVTVEDFLLGMDTATTDLSFHLALKALIASDNILYCTWHILSQAESMQTLHRNGQEILATFICYSKNQFTVRQASYLFCWNLNEKICLVSSMEFWIKMAKEDAESAAVWGPEHLYGYCVFGFLTLFSCLILWCLPQPHKFIFFLGNIFLKFEMFLARKKHFISISTISIYETSSYVGWDIASREAAYSHAYSMTPYHPWNIAEETA